MGRTGLGTRVQWRRGVWAGSCLYRAVGLCSGTRLHHASAALPSRLHDASQGRFDSHAAAPDLLCQATQRGASNEPIGTGSRSSAGLLLLSSRGAWTQRCGVSAGVSRSFGHTAGAALASQGPRLPGGYILCYVKLALLLSACVCVLCAGLLNAGCLLACSCNSGVIAPFARGSSLLVVH